MPILFVRYPSWITPYIIPGVIRWYGAMYIVAFSIAYFLFSYQRKHDGTVDITQQEQQDFFFIGIVLLLVFARVFSVVFYIDAKYYLTHPWMIFWPFRNGKFVGLAGMSYHGGVFGAILGGWIYAKRHKKSLAQLADAACAGIPLGYTFGRLGNFFNAELYGRVTKSPLGMIFPNAEKFSTTFEWVRDIADAVGLPYIEGAAVNLPRHPSQLYEAFFEGIVLFLVLWFIVRKLKIKKKLPDGTILSAYLFGYGMARFFIEYCRQPDKEIGYVIKAGKGSGNIAVFSSFLNISKGQIFCLVMMVAGVALEIALLWRKRNAIAVETKKHSGRRRH